MIFCLEVCSGRGNLSGAISDIVGYMATFEVLNAPEEDLLKISGVKLMLTLLLRIMKGGLLWVGPPCSSWITISRS